MQFTSNPDPTTTMLYDYLPALIILLSIAFILFLSLKLRGATTPATLSAVAIVNFIVTILMYPLDIVSGKILVVGILLVPISFFVLWISES